MIYQSGWKWFDRKAPLGKRGRPFKSRSNGSECGTGHAHAAFISPLQFPFFDRSTTVEVRGQSIPVRQDLIVVWVSISEIGLPELHSKTPKFPAIVDTGCNHSFVIRERHLIDWAGIHPQYLRTLRPTRVDGSAVAQLAANIWLHPTSPALATTFPTKRRF